MGMGIEMGKTRLDERGRVTVPQKLREELGLSPGDDVLVERAEEGVLVRRIHSKKATFRELRGIVTARNATADEDPMALKRLLRASD